MARTNVGDLTSQITSNPSSISDNIAGLGGGLDSKALKQSLLQTLLSSGLLSKLNEQKNQRPLISDGAVNIPQDLPNSLGQGQGFAPSGVSFLGGLTHPRNQTADELSAGLSFGNNMFNATNQISKAFRGQPETPSDIDALIQKLLEEALQSGGGTGG